MHDPEVLILDEPTSGLDPNQLVEIRSLIKQIGEQRTVIFSTHIMQEVQALCDRVLIINKGNLVADDTIDTLQQRVTGESVVTVEFAETTNAKKLETIKGVKKVNILKDKTFQIFASADSDVRAEVFRFAVDNRLTLLGMQKEVFSVEDVFRELTK